MPGLVPGIHVFYRPTNQDVDGRDRPGHDGVSKMPDMPTLVSLAGDLEAGRTTARALVDACLANIADKDGEGARAFLYVDAEAAIEAAEAMDRLREVKAAPSPF